MRWSFQHQFVYALGVLVIFALVGFGIWFAYFHQAPSCFDGAMNGDETGVDCGGSCATLCEAPTVTALWARSVEVAPGVYHAVAMVQNPLTNAGTLSLPYKFSLYDADNVLVAERASTMFLYPGDVVPLFEPDIGTGNRIPARTLIDFGPAVWEKMDRPETPIVIDSQNLDQTALRLDATVENTTALPVNTFSLTALLYSADGTLIAASQTNIPVLNARAQKAVVFTWQEPFSAPVVKADIIPRVAPVTN